MKKIVSLLLMAATLFQCASVYRPIDPKTIPYTAKEETDDLIFEYRYDVLAYRNNKKYSKREKKHAYNVLAAKITNKTGRTLKFGEDIDLSIKRGAIAPAPPEATAKVIHQPVVIYLLYGLLVAYSEDCVGTDCHVTSVIPFGLGIAALNMIISGSSNAKMKKELQEYDIRNKEIKPGETIHAIIGIPDYGFAPLSLTVRN